jgi:hypothetical protein
MSIRPGFDFTEAAALLQICNKLYDMTPGITPPRTPTCGVPPVPDPPANWVVEFKPSEAVGLQNYWELWRNTAVPGQYAVGIRGTIATDASILEDILLPLIPARGMLPVLDLQYQLADTPAGSHVQAGVHLGFAIGTLSLLFLGGTSGIWLKLWEYINIPQSGKPAATEILVTGHSQGASIALLLQSFLHYQKTLQAAFKTYVYAPAKPGNDAYAWDVSRTTGVRGYCYSVVSNQGWVPQVPLTLQTFGDMNRPNPIWEASGSVNPAIPTEIKALLGDLTALERTIAEDLQSFIDRLIHWLEQHLDAIGATLPLSRTGMAAADLTLTGPQLQAMAAASRDLVLPSLDYAMAGTVAALQAVAGGNPTDDTPGCQSFDFFWQHHLGNYWKYLQAQYGP